MNRKYLHQFKNRNIRNLLLRKESLAPLEEIIWEKTFRRAQYDPAERIILESTFNPSILSDKARLENLGSYVQKVEEHKNNMRKWTRKDLLEEFAGVKNEVDTFLGVENISSPWVGLPSFNNPKNMFMGAIMAISANGIMQWFVNPSPNLINVAGYVLNWYIIVQANRLRRAGDNYFPVYATITLGNEKRTIGEVVTVLSHEYAHHVQKKFGIYSYLRNMLFCQEGHARGVQRAIVSQKSEDRDYARWTEYVDSAELKMIYTYLCSKYNNVSFLAGPAMRQCTSFDAECIIRGMKGNLSPHAIGNALFSIYEKKYGNCIFRDIIKGEFEF